MQIAQVDALVGLASSVCRVVGALAPEVENLVKILTAVIERRVSFVDIGKEDRCVDVVVVGRHVGKIGVQVEHGRVVVAIAAVVGHQATGVHIGAEIIVAVVVVISVGLEVCHVHVA